MAAGEGFEPSHTESESAVLPLHKPAIFYMFIATNRYYYTEKRKIVNRLFETFLKKFWGLDQPPKPLQTAPYWVKCSWLKM